MKATIHVEGNNAYELAQGLRAHLAIYEGTTAHDNDTGQTAATQSVSPSTSQTAKTKKAAPAVEETFGDEESEIEAAEETDMSSQEEQELKYNVEDVRKAFAGYVKKGIKRGETQEASRTKAVSILKKNFKVTRIDDLKVEQYGAAIELVS